MSSQVIAFLSNAEKERDKIINLDTIYLPTVDETYFLQGQTVKIISPYKRRAHSEHIAFKIEVSGNEFYILRNICHFSNDRKSPDWEVQLANLDCFTEEAKKRYQNEQKTPPYRMQPNLWKKNIDFTNKKATTLFLQFLILYGNTEEVLTRS